MNDHSEYQGMVPFQAIFPDSGEGDRILALPAKVGKARAGEYFFAETYCIEKGCDCRRTTILVFDGKGKQSAAIDFGFDPDQPLAGPYLNELEKQSAAAEDLLRIFVKAINKEADWLPGMYERYRQVRRRVDGRAYRGKPFPEPGKVRREITRPEPLAESVLDAFMEILEKPVPLSPGRRKGRQKRQLDLLDLLVRPEPLALPEFIERYRRLERGEDFTPYREIQEQLLHYLLDHDMAGDELATLVVRCFEGAEKDEARFEAVLRLLGDALEILRTELERQRPGSEQRMVRLQEALARRVFIENGEGDLCAAVTQALLQARVEILPQLHEAGRQRIMAVEQDDFLRHRLGRIQPEEAIIELCRSLDELETDSPYELLEILLQMTAVGDADIQVNLSGAMLRSGSAAIRDTVPLMLFHPLAEVREGMGQMLAAAEGSLFSPATLRRLIVARNWFPEALRNRIDQTVAKARKARVECAPLGQPREMTVHASAIDGAGAQTFQVVLPDGKGFVSGSILLKEGNGVADAFVISLENKRDLREFLAAIAREAGCLESTPEYLDLRICQALAEGARLGKVPSPWLLAIAERLGRDQWRAIPRESRQELAALREILAQKDPGALSARARQEALEASEAWPEREPFAFSWFEDNAEVDRQIAAAGIGKKAPPVARAVKRLLDQVLEKRRDIWLDRLVLTTLWLKSAKKPPVPWPRMFQVAAALADAKIPLKDIPLMVAIAQSSFGAHLARRERGIG